MSNAALQYRKFAEQAVAGGEVFTFTENEDFLVYMIDGSEVVPFWSSASRLASVVKMHPKYAPYQRKSMPLAEFLAWLPDLESQKIRLGMNWAGKQLTGYSVEPSRVAAMIEYEKSKAKTVVNGPWKSA